jgi:cyclopropane-fatty-acyl-phospholipid synthase
MYSCALWGEAEGGVRGDLELGPTPGDLESAQRRKIHHVLRAARVKPGHRILEFGSGWGGLAIEVSILSFQTSIYHNLPPRLHVVLDAKLIL